MYVSPLNAKYNIIISPIKNIIKVTRNGNVKQAIKNKKNKKMLAFIKSFIYNNHCVRESKTKNFWKPEEI